MAGVLIGFAIIGFVIVVGYVVARLGILGPTGREVLSRMAFFVAAPALLFTILSEADLHVLFSSLLAVAAISAVLAFAIYFVIARFIFKTKAADAMIGSAASGYLNANNIGLPVASYVLGDPKYVAPVILFQLLVLAPITLGVLDGLDGGRVSVRSILTQPLRNPIIIASIAGAVVAATGITIPAPVLAPLEIIGGAAIPLMLIAFGMSLRGQRPFQAGAERREIATASAIKLVVMPLMAWAIAYYAFGLTGQALYVSVVLAALPTAQNIYNFAVRYDRGVVVARDTILLTTVLAVPVLLVVALLLS